MEQLDKIVLKAKMLPISQKEVVTQGAYALDGKMHVTYGKEEFEMFLDRLSLQGRHVRRNRGNLRPEAAG